MSKSLYHQTTKKKKSKRVQDITLNSIWWWEACSSLEECGINPLLPLLPVPLRSEEIVTVWIPSHGQINLFENYQYQNEIFEVI